MLYVEECDYKDHKVIYYRNSNKSIVKTTILDLNCNIIQVVISKYDQMGRNICDVLFGRNPTKIIAYREYLFNDNEKHESGWIDYKKVNGIFIKLHSKSSHWIIKGELARCNWFYPNGELAYYELFKFCDDIKQMCKEFSYFPNDEVILDSVDTPKLEHFDNYYLDFI